MYMFSVGYKHKLLKQFMDVRFSLTPGLIQGLTEVNTKANRFNGFKVVAKHSATCQLLPVKPPTSPIVPPYSFLLAIQAVSVSLCRSAN
jgi:hypothetical protein